jgi:hypothetical protein
VLGAFQEGTIYGGSRSVSGAFLIVRDDQEVGYNLFLSGSQTEALWNSRKPRLVRLQLRVWIYLLMAKTD